MKIFVEEISIHNYICLCHNLFRLCVVQFKTCVLGFWKNFHQMPVQFDETEP